MKLRYTNTIEPISIHSLSNEYIYKINTILGCNYLTVCDACCCIYIGDSPDIELMSCYYKETETYKQIVSELYECEIFMENH